MASASPSTTASPAWPPSHFRYSGKARKTPQATSASPKRSRWRCSMSGSRGAHVADERRARARVAPRAGGLRLRPAAEAEVADFEVGAGLRLRWAGVRVVAIARTLTFDAPRRVPPGAADRA